ncbi:RHS repeat domain-containing protein [Paenibacillus sp. NPDC055715]
MKNQYDANGNRIKMKEPFGSEVSYTYDTRNRLTSAGTDPSSPDAKYTYYKNGLLEQMIGFNGLKHQFQYAGIDLARLNVNQGEQTVDDFKYTRDGSKNIVKREQKSLVEHEETTDLFQYDVLNRVVDSSEYKASYEYDTRGNRQTLTTERPLKTVPSEYSYDAENRLTQVRKNGKNVQYNYNGDGLLVGRIEGGVQTRYYYDGDQMIAEATVENGTPQLKARYIWGQKLEAIQYADGTKAYPIYNGHGDIVELRDSKGNVLNTYNYDIWGNITSSQEKVYNPFRYSGELWDSTTELQYLRARWYDPDSGRFINEDTYEGDIANPLSLNFYTYVKNNPLRFIDPSGHIPTAMEAAEMAKNVYNITMSLNDRSRTNLLGGWGIYDILPGSEGLKIGVYSRKNKKGTLEYALVNKGTDTWGDVGNDIQQPIGYSDDMKDSISQSSYFVATHKYSEITMVGHSKGGAEAIANAVANNKNAITFNPAVPSLGKYGLSNKDYTANAINYVVKDEILSKTLGSVDTGITIYLPTQYKIKWWHSDAYKTWQMVQNHRMGSVINALKEVGYK